MWKFELLHGSISFNLLFRLWAVVLEKTFDCPLDYKEIQPVH